MSKAIMESKKKNPVVYSQKIAAEICIRIMTGDSLNKICSGQGFPNKSTVYRWLSNPELKTFCDQYARAREVQADLLADELIDIADDDTMETVNRSRLRIDARKWIASKLLPKKYGRDTRNIPLSYAR